MNIDEEKTGRISWDSVRATAPARPRLVPNLTEEQRIPRPRRVGYALIFVTVAALILGVVTGLAAGHYVNIRGSLAALLLEELDDGYSTDDIQLAVNVLLGAAWGGALLLSLVHILSAQAVMLRKSAGARVLLVTSVILFLPVAVIAASLRNANGPDLVASGGGILLLCAAAVIVGTPKVSWWLHQSDKPERQPLLLAVSLDEATTPLPAGVKSTER